MQQRRGFGASDMLRCERCGGTMFLSRRTPHAELGAGYELQTFECRTCGHELSRSADNAGKPHG